MKRNTSGNCDWALLGTKYLPGTDSEVTFFLSGARARRFQSVVILRLKTLWEQAKTRALKDEILNITSKISGLGTIQVTSRLMRAAKRSVLKGFKSGIT